MSLELALDALMPKKFVDRDALTEMAQKSLTCLINNSSYFDVISISGMGGIGKSRFLHEFMRPLDAMPKVKLIYASLEVDHDDTFHTLLRIRKSICQSCYLFDYALIVLAESYLVEKINDDFLNALKKSLTSHLLSMGQGLISVPSIGMDSAIETLNMLINSFKITYAEEKNWEIVQRLKRLYEYSPKQLFELLPALLGFDLEKIAESRRLVVILDSCDSQGYDSTWLNRLLDQTSNGLFILTSREHLQLKTPFAHFYHMQEIPEEEAEKYLKCYIAPQHQAAVIPQLISSTECIPIYLDLAVSTYLRWKHDPHYDIIESFCFDDKQKIVQAFLDHLPDKQQETILTLAVVCIFDNHVFNHLVSDLNLPVSKLDYHNICNISMIDNLNLDCDLKTFHNIIHRNISKTVLPEIKYVTFQSYLSFVSQRGIFLYPNEVLRVYFLNILHLVFENQFTLRIQETEQVLDLYFALQDQRVECAITDRALDNPNWVLLTFLSAASLLHSDVKGCLSKLGEIKTSIDLLGKHRNSFYVIKYYSLSIAGKYQQIKPQIARTCAELQDNMIADWYYGKLKIYFADYLMLTGDFCEAIARFDEYQNEIAGYAEIKENDIFESQKQKGHCYRLNFLLDSAAGIYAQLEDTYAAIPFRKSYSQTCLCETKCYFDPEYVIAHYHRSLQIAKEVGQERSRAKIYYSLGIAYTVKHEFEKARSSIRESIRINEQCDYPAGKLFALIAKCYYCYASSGSVPKRLVAEAETLSAKLHVYEYLLLPVYMMQQDTKKIASLQGKYQWLDWEQTLENYSAFIRSLLH